MLFPEFINSSSYYLSAILAIIVVFHTLVISEYQGRWLILLTYIIWSGFIVCYSIFYPENMDDLIYSAFYSSVIFILLTFGVMKDLVHYFSSYFTLFVFGIISLSGIWISWFFDLLFGERSHKEGDFFE